MHRRSIPFEGSVITVEDHGGQGRPVLAVHGLGGSAGNWALLAPSLVPFARVIAVDLPGHGRSGPAPRHDLDTHARAVLATIDRVIGAPVLLLANSMGALVAQMVAQQRPDTVEALVLLAPATPHPRWTVPSAPELALRLAVQSLPGLGRLATNAYIARRTPSEQVDDTMSIVMHDPTKLPAAERARAAEIAALRRTMPWASRAFAESTASVRRTFLAGRRFRRMVGAVTAPTTVLFGSEDRVVVPAAIRWLGDLRPDWRLVELPGTGHTAMWECPDVVAREVLDRMPRGA